MNSAGREITIGPGQKVRRGLDVLRGNQMRDIDYMDFRIIAQYDAFKDSRIFIGQAKIGNKCHQGMQNT
jgi:hypothetical protein